MCGIFFRVDWLGCLGVVAFVVPLILGACSAALITLDFVNLCVTIGVEGDEFGRYGWNTLMAVLHGWE